MMVVFGTLPGSGRRFRIGVSEHAAGVWVEPSAVDPDPFVAVVARRIGTVAAAEALIDVSQYVLTGKETNR